MRMRPVKVSIGHIHHWSTLYQVIDLPFGLIYQFTISQTAVKVAEWQKQCWNDGGSLFIPAPVSLRCVCVRVCGDEGRCVSLQYVNVVLCVLWQHTVTCVSHQVFVHLSTLERSIIWSRSVLNARCRICRRKGDADNMLLCDGCDRGHHTHCLRPRLKVKYPNPTYHMTLTSVIFLNFHSTKQVKVKHLSFCQWVLLLVQREN